MLLLLLHIEARTDGCPGGILLKALNLVFTRIPDCFLLYRVAAHLIRYDLGIAAVSAHPQEARQRSMLILHIEVVNPLPVYGKGICNDTGGRFGSALFLHLFGEHSLSRFAVQSAGDVLERTVLSEMKGFALHIVITRQHIAFLVEVIERILIFKPAALHPLAVCRKIASSPRTLVPTGIGKCTSAFRGSVFRSFHRTADCRLGAMYRPGFPVQISEEQRDRGKGRAYAAQRQEPLHACLETALFRLLLPGAEHTDALFERNQHRCRSLGELLIGAVIRRKFNHRRQFPAVLFHTFPQQNAKPGTENTGLRDTLSLIPNFFIER